MGSLRKQRRRIVTGLGAAAQSTSEILLDWNRIPVADSYRVYRDGSLAGSATQAVSPTYTDSGLSAGTSYSYAVTYLQGSAESASSGAVTEATQAPAQGWQTVPDISFTEGVPANSSFGSYAPAAEDVFWLFDAGTSATASLTVGLSLDSDNMRIVHDGTTPVGSYGPYYISGATSAEADWQTRISGAGVVWYHDFRSDAEVNAFRWTPGYANGNDPLAVGSSLAPLVRRITTDGITGACLEILRPSGTQDGSDWWRPFSPMTSPGNGKPSNDPGANGTLPIRTYNATDGGSQISGWGNGYYGYANGHSYDGSGYYFQVRVKMDPRRATGNNANIGAGKLFIIGRADRSNVDQKIVVYSGNIQGGVNYFRMYSANYGDLPLDQHPPGVAVHGNQPSTEWGVVGDGLCRLDNDGGRLGNCWYYPNPAQWVTLMWHVVPGTNNGSNTLIEVFAAIPPATSFTRIWYQPNANLIYDASYPTGHNAVHLSTYLNGELGDEMWHRYCQLIFSKNFIPCPQV